MIFLAIGGILGLGLLGVFNIQLIPNFELFGLSFNWFTALCILGVIWVFIQYGSKSQALLFSLITILVAVSGVYAVQNFLAVRADKARFNSTHGSIEYVDLFEDLNVYDVKLDEIVFYKNGSVYSFNVEFEKAFDFNGTINKYNLLVNDAPAVTVSSTNNLSGYCELAFYDINGSFICTIPLEVRFSFALKKTTIEIKAAVNTADSAYLMQYVEVNGLRLRLIEEQYSLG